MTNLRNDVIKWAWMSRGNATTLAEPNRDKGPVRHTLPRPAGDRRFPHQRKRKTRHSPVKKIVLRDVHRDAAVQLKAKIISTQAPNGADTARANGINQDRSTLTGFEIIHGKARATLLEKADIVDKKLHAVDRAPIEVEEQPKCLNPLPWRLAEIQQNMVPLAGL